MHNPVVPAALSVAALLVALAAIAVMLLGSDGATGRHRPAVEPVTEPEPVEVTEVLPLCPLDAGWDWRAAAEELEERAPELVS